MKQTLLLPLLVLLSCVRVNVGSDSPKALIHKLDYEPALTQNSPSQMTARVLDFAATDEYDRKALVLVLRDGTVQRTSLHQWATAPPLALPNLLHRDLLMESSFRAVYRGGVARGEELVIEGFIREFGARESQDGWAGVIDVDVLMSCSGASPTQEQKTYRFSDQMPGEGYGVMVQTLSRLVSTWSQAVRSDILAFRDTRMAQ